MDLTPLSTPTPFPFFISAVMTYQLDDLPGLSDTDSDIAYTTQYLDDHLNTEIFYVLLHGLYSHLGFYCSSPIYQHT